ncbi:MAG: hypothetical protein H6Q89_3583, partial [Myxococcaceae bacterium]|nr:hypothetical protein [Myxococcaceae bacterium]
MPVRLIPTVLILTCGLALAAAPKGKPDGGKSPKLDLGL